MCPPIDVAEVDDLLSPESLKRELAARLAADLAGSRIKGLPSDWSDMFVSELLDESSPEQSVRFYSRTPIAMRNNLHVSMSQMRRGLAETLRLQREQFPAIKLQVQDIIHKSLRNALGALCLTKNGKHPLMWAHYADEHRGVIVEFETDYPCFNRGSYAEGVGRFVDVSYTKSRPTLNAASNENEEALRVLALSKAIDWEYEDEMRMLLPLADADEVVDGMYHLIKVNSGSVRAVVFGCRASDDFIDQVSQVIIADDEFVHVELYKATPCKKDYVLNYEALV
jgi:hypothetical protein